MAAGRQGLVGMDAATSARLRDGAAVAQHRRIGVCRARAGGMAVNLDWQGHRVVLRLDRDGRRENWVLSGCVARRRHPQGPMRTAAAAAPSKRPERSGACPTNYQTRAAASTPTRPPAAP
jgi:hypothetical protein